MNTIVNFISKLHGHSRFIFVDVFFEMLLKLAFKIRFFGDIEKFRNEYVLSYKSFSATKPFIKDPERFLKNMAIIQAYPKDGRKGILTIAYNYAIPSFMYLFDYEKIMERYHLVLEPSTARFLMPEILICDELKHPVYVQAGEPRDAQFLTRFSQTLIPIPIAANWWLNTNTFNDEVKVSKDIDILMVSSFNKLKRHNVLFKALKKLKNRDIKLSVVLIGYAGGELTKIDLEKIACDVGIQDQITVIENIGPEEVAQYYRRSKINVLLSKREGSSRIIIEGMHCGVPILLREGFNFGYKYPFITKESGMYFKDDTLDESILTLLKKVDEGSINTNKVINDLGINPVHACEIMKKCIYGENTIMDVHPKASGLHGMEYLIENVENIFQEEYLFLSSCFISK